MKCIHCGGPTIGDNIICDNCRRVDGYLAVENREKDLERKSKEYGRAHCIRCGNGVDFATCICNDLDQAYYDGAQENSRDAMEVIQNLVDAIPGQTEDADWWPDDLVNAVGFAKKFIEDRS